MATARNFAGAPFASDDQIARTVSANAAYIAWRGKRLAGAWQRRKTLVGDLFVRGGLHVMATLEPADEAGERQLTVSVSRASGSAPSEADVDAVLAAFVAPGAQVHRERRNRLVYLCASVSVEPTKPRDVRGWVPPERAHRVSDRGGGVTTMGLDDVPVPGPGWEVVMAAGLPIYVGPRCRVLVMQVKRPGGERWRQVVVHRDPGEGAGLAALLDHFLGRDAWAMIFPLDPPKGLPEGAISERYDVRLDRPAWARELFDANEYVMLVRPGVAMHVLRGKGGDRRAVASLDGVPPCPALRLPTGHCWECDLGYHLPCGS